MPARSSAIVSRPTQSTAEPKELPRIPTKLYFSISEVSSLCGVKDHTLRYWEEEFAAHLPKIDRRNGRRRYQREHIVLMRKIRELLHDHGYTIAGARKVLNEVRVTDSRRTSGPGAANAGILDGLTELRRLIDEARDSLKDADL